MGRKQNNIKHTDFITTEFLKDTTTRETGTHISSAICSKTKQTQNNPKQDVLNPGHWKQVPGYLSLSNSGKIPT